MRFIKVTAILASAAVLLGAAGTASADGRAKYDYAKVLSSEPIVRYVTVTRPVRQCWQDTEYYTVNHRAPRAKGGAIVGAVLGGVIGHQFGSGRGNDAATVAGTLIGAAIGSESARSRYDGPYGPTTYSRPVERCESRLEEQQEERIDGYRVVYRYHGQKYVTEMPYDPGNRIRVRVDVRPAA